MLVELGRNQLTIGFDEQIQGMNEFRAGEVLGGQRTPVEPPGIGECAFFGAREMGRRSFRQSLKGPHKIEFSIPVAVDSDQPAIQEISRKQHQPELIDEHGGDAQWFLAALQEAVECSDGLRQAPSTERIG